MGVVILFLGFHWTQVPKISIDLTGRTSYFIQCRSHSGPTPSPEGRLERSSEVVRLAGWIDPLFHAWAHAAQNHRKDRFVFVRTRQKSLRGLALSTFGKFGFQVRICEFFRSLVGIPQVSFASN